MCSRIFCAVLIGFIFFSWTLNKLNSYLIISTQRYLQTRWILLATGIFDCYFFKKKFASVTSACKSYSHPLLLFRTFHNIISMLFFSLHPCVRVCFALYFLSMKKKSRNLCILSFRKWWMKNIFFFACGVTSITRDGEQHIYSIQNEIERKFLFCH